jgi:nicotinamide mononucleotide adenylyltransferase/predicted nucleotidyltransferase
MSGVAGGNRIKKERVQETFADYIEKVLTKIPGFKHATLSGSIKTGSKADFGDLDLIVSFEGEDKKEVKQRIVDAVMALPSDVIVPFKSDKYKGKRYYNSGEMISVLFPISGEVDQFIQVDNIIALSEEEHNFKNSFLDLPAEKQGLMIGLTKVALLEEEPSEVFARLGIANLPELEESEEFEFNLSSVKLTLRKVKLEDFKEVSREEVWSSADWSKVEDLLQLFDLQGTFEELLEEISLKLKNPRSKNRVSGIFRSMVSVKSGEVGTPKGASKEAALQKVSQRLAESLEDGSNIVAIYAGGFKPPHKAHFENAKILSAKSDKLIVFIGSKIREGEIKITPEQSKEIWGIYSKYISVPVEIRISPVTPIKDTYDWVDANQDKVDEIITGTTAEEMKKFAYFVKNADKYPKVKLEELPIITSGEDEKFSASDLRKSEQFIAEGSWVPTILSEEDKKEVIDIILPKVESFKKFFSKKKFFV